MLCEEDRILRYKRHLPGTTRPLIRHLNIHTSSVHHKHHEAIEHMPSSYTIGTPAGPVMLMCCASAARTWMDCGGLMNAGWGGRYCGLKPPVGIGSPWTNRVAGTAARIGGWIGAATGGGGKVSRKVGSSFEMRSRSCLLTARSSASAVCSSLSLRGFSDNASYHKT